MRADGPKLPGSAGEVLTIKDNYYVSKIQRAHCNSFSL
jgi:hypothetical protein